MNSTNAFVVMDEAKLAEARALDVYHDQWTARLIRWVKFRVSPKSAICGAEWDRQQANFNYYENWLARKRHYMPNLPTELTWNNLPSHGTGSLTSQGLFERARIQELADEKAAREKFDAGEELTEEEQNIYNAWAAMVVYDREAEARAALTANIPPSVRWGSTDESEECKIQSQTSVCTDEEANVKKSKADAWTASEWVQPVHTDSPQSTLSSTSGSESEAEYATYVVTLGDCSQKLTKRQIRREYLDDHVRGIAYDLPAGLGLHVRKPPSTIGTFPSVTPDDILENLPGNISYVFRPGNDDYQLTKHGILMIEAAPGAKNPQDGLSTIYNPEYSHKDNSWVAKENPQVTEQMMKEYHAEIEHNRNEAVKTLDWLKLFGKNMELLTPMVHTIMKDTKLCEAIHKELVARDIGLLKQDNDKNFRFHGQVETVLTNLDRWASTDIDSAIEDVRLILEDHELMFQIIDAFNGEGTQTDSRPFIDPKPSSKKCVQCDKGMEELGVMYGKDHSTLMATGCRLCDDIRLKKANKLLWKWYKKPGLIDDEQYKKIFGVEKGFEMPEEEYEMAYGDEEGGFDEEHVEAYGKEDDVEEA